MSNLPAKIFINSMPKSGTHLLIKAVELLGYQSFRNNFFKKLMIKTGFYMPCALIYEEVNRNVPFRIMRRFKKDRESIKIGVMSPVEVPYAVCKRWLGRINDGFYIAGQPYSELFEKVLDELRLKHILIVRDPRDVIISMAHYMAREDHKVSRCFIQMSFAERIKFLIEGGKLQISVKEERAFLGFRDAYESIVEWKRKNKALIVRFEDMVGSKGGGSGEQQLGAISRIAEYLDITDNIVIKKACEGMYDKSSPTFRNGEIGSWKDEFTAELLKDFEHMMLNVFVELGYDV